MSQSSIPAVECRGITKSFGDGEGLVWALKGVDLTVANGEVLMLVGPSGCGKTTLISIIAAVLSPTAGDCLLFGESLRAMSGAAKAKLRAKELGFVFQSFNLIPSLTAQENVAVPLIIQGYSRPEALARAAQQLAEVGLGDHLNQLPSQLSGGQQQRVAIARSLVHDPRLIVCDEPTSALDEKNGHMVMEVFRTLAKQRGKTLIVVTHDSRIFEYGDRIVRMNDGVVV